MNRTRPYTLKRRAENQAETRRRIVEATVDLHTEVGPSRTSISAIAVRAGVQRHTVYAHFPTARELFLACSGLTLECDPLPDADTLRRIANREQRLRRGLSELYAWYGRNAELANSVMRDAEVDPLTRDIVRLRMSPRFEALHAVLAQGFPCWADARRCARPRAQLPHLAIAYAGQSIECRCGCGICDAHDTLYCRTTGLIRPTFDRRAIAYFFSARSAAKHLDNRRAARHRKGFCERRARARSP